VTGLRSGAGSPAVTQRTAAAVLLGGAHLLISARSTCRARPPGLSGRRSSRLSATLAFAGPVLSISRVLLRRRAQWRPPASPAGNLLLGLHVVAGAITEEVIWRSPLIHICSAQGRAIATLGGAVAFVGLHLPRDGARGLPVHALNTLAWTSATLIDRRIRWSVSSHAAYNYVAVALAPAADSARTRPS
jgi:membrane protease YdiL (CAAX protease family)